MQSLPNPSTCALIDFFCVGVSLLHIPSMKNQRRRRGRRAEETGPVVKWVPRHQPLNASTRAPSFRGVRGPGNLGADKNLIPERCNAAARECAVRRILGLFMHKNVLWTAFCTEIWHYKVWGALLEGQKRLGLGERRSFWLGFSLNHCSSHHQILKWWNLSLFYLFIRWFVLTLLVENYVIVGFYSLPGNIMVVFRL